MWAGRVCQRGLLLASRALEEGSQDHLHMPRGCMPSCTSDHHKRDPGPPGKGYQGLLLMVSTSDLRHDLPEIWDLAGNLGISRGAYAGALWWFKDCEVSLTVSGI